MPKVSAALMTERQGGYLYRATILLRINDKSYSQTFRF